MKNNYNNNSTKTLTADEIYTRLINEVCPLPSQESYVKQLSALISLHLKKNMLLDYGFTADEVPSPSWVVVAPTGSGKTYLLRAASKILDINIITIDGSSLSREGWRGMTLSEQLFGSKKALNDDTKWKSSILFIDEFDKLRLWKTEKDQGSPLDNILQLYNQSTIVAEDDNRTVQTLDISRFTIVLAGAFDDGLDKIIAERLAPKKSIGFSSNESISNNLSKAELIKRATPEDIQKYGYTPELVGRISSIISINPMTKEDYKCLLSEHKGSLSYKYATFYRYGYGVDFKVDESAIEYIANKCLLTNTGARAVNPIVNDIMREAQIFVDRDVSINRIILKANEEGCYLEYEHGERMPSPILEGYTVSAETTEQLSNVLTNVYRESHSDPRLISQFNCFLNLTTEYLLNCCNKDDFTYGSLKKLADTVRKNDKGQESTYDIIIKDALKEEAPAITKRIAKYYEQFQTSWCENSANMLITALNEVEQAIKRKHHACSVDLKIERKQASR